MRLRAEADSRFLRRKLRDMSAFEIVGGNALKGTVIPQGAKNEALQIISAVLLTAEPIVIRNIPEIIDVLKLIDLLQDIGVKVEKLAKGEYKFIADDVNLEYLKTEDGFEKLPKQNVDFGGGLERIAAAKLGDPQLL